MEQAGFHTTVLLDEAVDALVTRADGIYVDGTFGRGGHTRALLARLGANARVLGFDKDPAAVAAATEGATRIADERFEIIHASFAELPARRRELSVTAQAYAAEVKANEFPAPEHSFES